MSKRWWVNVLSLAWFPALVVVLLLADCSVFVKAKEECDRLGGVVVRSDGHYVCVQLVKHG